MHQTLHPLAPLTEPGGVGDIGERLAVQRVEFLFDPAGSHRVPIAVPQQDETRRYGQFGGDKLAHVRTLAARFFGVADRQRRYVSHVRDITRSSHAATLLQGAAAAYRPRATAARPKVTNAEGTWSLPRDE
ncbi:hypothetical protein MAGR_17610 [Mycolicibacterium agri]|uniref:Uncharacterized protein n=1 Tax=Mycolicibacterium agri TaxID=36811 RepID=A0A7I9VYB9_MYCAG|nr:hypothetical protein MAGR_17610 [Mycolicibacterium agri]